ncbi:MAG: nucleotidyl transferase AbiEii/AbiGii toxin family protein [candidate division Zixibacteria bacterium]|nr:nucleotidyl transferase AbiEii/AbiGii toxin family protein [candidate division Zixibacteria bacterium]
MSVAVRDFAKRPDNDRRDLFMATAEAMKVHQAIVEKDFWVCWILDYLFQESQWKDKIIFKGGTSLSKAYGAIHRFSEDVDLILDWSLLGLTEAEAFEDRSGKKQDEFRDEVDRRLLDFLKNDLTPVLETELRTRLGRETKIVQEEKLILIEYPRSFSSEAIRPEIILEIGPRALAEPNEQKDVRSFAAEKFPALFVRQFTTVTTVLAERTFWEKATILHHEAHKTNDKSLHRCSRHYYDLYQLGRTPILDKALKRLDLLEEVVHFKMKFYRRKWAKYEDAKPGTLRLLPPDHNLSPLKKDYASMQAMIFGAIPKFDEIMEGLAAVETEINSRGRIQQ